MQIEIVVVPECPNEQVTADRLRQALDEGGLLEVRFTTRVIADQAKAERIGFTGSPTILVDGHDPFAEPGRTPGIACRLYPTPQGLDGAPAVNQLRQALPAAAGEHS
jgi:hypothetical protein